MTNVRVMFIGQGASGLPEDRIVNVFHFSGTDPTESMQLAGMQRVADFYMVVGPAGPLLSAAPIGSYLSDWVNREAEIRTYDLADLKPRVPIITAITLPAVGAGQGLPEEVALCLSYSGAPPATPRRRGRIYIGPLGTNAGVASSGSQAGPTRPDPDFVNDLAKSAQRMVALNSPGCSWVIRSTKPAENFVPIVKGYVDNAWDTQRRRGPETTDRVLWTAPAL